MHRAGAEMENSPVSPVGSSVTASGTGPEPKVTRQAIVLVHGMGEQIPMETVRDFAEAVWTDDSQLRDDEPGELFFVPDPKSGSRELRRISTRRSRPREDKDGRYRVRNDFFELYWADAATDTTWRDFLSWYGHLVLRGPANVPRPVFYIWMLLWLVNVVFVLAVEVAAIWLVPEALFEDQTTGPARNILFLALAIAFGAWGLSKLRWPLFPKWACTWASVAGGFVAIWCVVVLIALVIRPPLSKFAGEHTVFWPGLAVVLSTALLLLQGFLILFFGDVGRYTVASPGNIAARQKVRDRGLELLKQLSCSGRYDRIVLVAHSLGTIVAYDILSLLWAEYVSSIDKNQKLVPVAEAGSSLERAIEAVTTAIGASPFDLSAFRDAQRQFFRELQEADRHRLKGIVSNPEDPIARWLISDFITIACPLTHAEFLLAGTASELKARFTRRELQMCPPTPEAGGGATPRLTYVKWRDGRRHHRFLHDSVFAAVRWTNIHDAPKNPLFFLRGDFISGPVASLFGKGVLDINVQPSWPDGALPPRMFTHTIYWQINQGVRRTPASVMAIRNAINLLDEEATESELIKMA
jgi:hypothetical protein